MKFTRLLPRYAYVGQFTLENLLPGLRGQSLGSNLSTIDLSNVTTLALPSGATIGGSSVVALSTITSTSANALTVGRQGTTNPAFNVDSSTGSQAAGLNVVGATAAGTVAVAVISSGAAANLTIDALGTGTIGIGTVSTGAITLGAATTISGNLTLSTKNIVTDTSTGTKIGTATNQKFGFYNSTPVVQPATTGTTTGFTVVGTSAVVAPESTFTGNTGSTAYTIGDIIKNLKTIGLLAS